MKLKLRKHRTVPLILAALILGLVPLSLPAFAGPAAVTGDLAPDTGQPPGQAASFSFTIGVSARTMSEFELTLPSGYQLVTVNTPPSGTVVPGSSVKVTGLAISGTETLTVSFTAKTACTAGPHDWTLSAKDNQGRAYAISSASDLATNVAGNCVLALLNQPKDTKVGDTITDGDRVTGGFIRVQLLDAPGGNPVTHTSVAVTFELGSDPSDGAADLDVATEITQANGVATFDTLLEIDLANVAEFTDYTLVPKGAAFPSITGLPSAGFDIWEDATSCQGQGQNCVLTHGDDTYTVPNGQAGALLSASTFDPLESNIQCAGYTPITSEVIWHEYTGVGPVLVTIHITRQEMKASSANGQRLVKVCEGLVDDPSGSPTGEDKWAALGVVADHQDSDGDGEDDIWVALAPQCPNQNASAFAPCIARQYGDGNGGNFTEVWLTGGDPPRRT